MKISELITSNPQKTGFSFEVLPPLKGKNIEHLFKNIDVLMEFDPLYINITTHRSELVFKSTSDGLYQRVSERNRPGTVAVAAAIQQKYGIPAVPHIICSGFSKTETEHALIDLNFLGINNLLTLRGDKAKHENRYIPVENGHLHASELIEQINKFNNGYFIDGTNMDISNNNRFSYGIAGYPEKHEEAPNIEIRSEDLKVDTYRSSGAGGQHVNKTEILKEKGKDYEKTKIVHSFIVGSFIIKRNNNSADGFCSRKCFVSILARQDK